ncbi:MAG: type VI secretion system-associated protein TagF [Methylococcaceae bacterium]|nr:type VI secretion system-associated protein TagF [Methylococcaceae bacterium]
MAKGTVGFYGKLPIVGDFITRRLPKEFINTLDQWMQSGVSVSKEELGSDWLDLYLTSPIWRFAFQPGVCGEEAWAGIMMPSVDKVGRYYPLTIACKVEEVNDLALILAHCSDWFARLEEIALAGLEENYNLDGFNDVLLGVDTPELKKERASIYVEHNDQLSTHLISEVKCTETLAISDSLMLAGLDAFSQKGGRYSLWLNMGSDAEKGSVKIFKGLPTGHDYSVMIG